MSKPTEKGKWASSAPNQITFYKGDDVIREVTVDELIQLFWQAEAEVNALADLIDTVQAELETRFVDLAEDGLDVFVGYIVLGAAPTVDGWQPDPDADEIRKHYEDSE